MALDRIKDLEPIPADGRSLDGNGNNYEWRSPQGETYRYERDRGAVGKEIESSGGMRRFEWYVLQKNDLSGAKKRVFQLINEDEA